MSAAAPTVAPPRANPAPLPGSHPVKCLVYGDAGSFKSKFLSTFPKPIIIHQTDPWGKEGWYMRLGTPSALHQTDAGLPFREITAPDGSLAARIEFFVDANPTKPTGLALFRRRYAELFESGEIRQYATYGLDSVTWLDQLAENESRIINPNPSGGDQRGGLHAMYSKLQLQQILQGRIAGFPPIINIVVIAHIDQKQDEEQGTTLYNPAAPGKLSKRLPTGFSEMYRAYIAPDGKGGSEPRLQTRADFRYNAGTQIPAPNPCPPDWAALWRDVKKP